MRLRMLYEQLNRTPVEDAWFEVLKPEEKTVISRYFEIPREQYYNKPSYDRGHWAVEQLHLIHELMPFPEGGNRISIGSWMEQAKEEGIITANEMISLKDFCIHALMF